MSGKTFETFVNQLPYLTVSQSGCRKKFVKFYLRSNRLEVAGIAQGPANTTLTRHALLTGLQQCFVRGHLYGIRTNP